MLGEAPEWATKWAKAQEDDHLLHLPMELGGLELPCHLFAFYEMSICS